MADFFKITSVKLADGKSYDLKFSMGSGIWLRSKGINIMEGLNSSEAHRAAVAKCELDPSEENKQQRNLVAMNELRPKLNFVTINIAHIVRAGVMAAATSESAPESLIPINFITDLPLHELDQLVTVVFSCLIRDLTNNEKVNSPAVAADPNEQIQ